MPSKNDRPLLLARRRLNQPQPTGKYRNLQVWILGLCILQFRLSSTDDYTVKIVLRMGGNVALVGRRNLAKRALRKKKFLKGSRSNDWVKGSKGSCELRTFDIFTFAFCQTSASLTLVINYTPMMFLQ